MAVQRGAATRSSRGRRLRLLRGLSRGVNTSCETTHPPSSPPCSLVCRPFARLACSFVGSSSSSTPRVLLLSFLLLLYSSYLLLGRLLGPLEREYALCRACIVGALGLWNLHRNVGKERERERERSPSRGQESSLRWIRARSRIVTLSRSEGGIRALLGRAVSRSTNDR